MTLEDNLKFSKHKELKGRSSYIHYANYDAIDVPYTDAIPSNYDEKWEFLSVSWISIVLNNLRLSGKHKVTLAKL